MNASGTAETRIHLEGTRPLHGEVDTNEDGRADRWERYGASGEVESVGLSTKDDGKPTAWVHRGADGRIVRIEHSSTGDGRISRTAFYANGSLERIEEDSNGDGQIDRWETYAQGKLRSVLYAPTAPGDEFLLVRYDEDRTSVVTAPHGPSNGTTR
jgi:hypothetical protein